MQLLSSLTPFLFGLILLHFGTCDDTTTDKESATTAKSKDNGAEAQNQKGIEPTDTNANDKQSSRQNDWLESCTITNGSDPCETPAMTCVNYGKIYNGGPDVSVCDCVVPTNLTDCHCNTTSGKIVRRWEHSAGNPTIPAKPKNVISWPAIGFSNPGCYLENGELCLMSKHAAPDAQVYEVCKYRHHCESIVGSASYGFCLRGNAPCHLLSTKLIFYLLVSVLCLLV